MKIVRFVLFSTGVIPAIILAQTNTFPSSGNAGIGTTSPARHLDINATGTMGWSGAVTKGVRIMSPDWAGSTNFLGLDLEATYNAGTPLSGVLRLNRGSLTTFVGMEIGTFSSHPLRFVTNATSENGQERMRIDSVGNVGIGTTAPRAKLDISTGANESGAKILLQNQEIVVIDRYNSTDYSAKIWAAWPGYGLLHFGVNANAGAPDTVTPTITIKNINGVGTQGNVGIGTTNPNEPLEVAGNGRVFIGDGGGGSRKGLLIDAVEDGTYVRLHPYDYGTGSGLNLAITPYGSGNVGIGTAAPTHKLTVNGTIRAKEVIVDTNWADYVFADDYRLAPLSEVEAHIKAHKHLPDMPSAVEVAEKGVSMGEMQAKMMAKIEELTLHVIRMEKAQSALQAENQDLRSRIAELEGAPE